jgi:hypothetical protein
MARVDLQLHKGYSAPYACSQGSGRTGTRGSATAAALKVYFPAILLCKATPNPPS